MGVVRLGAKGQEQNSTEEWFADFLREIEYDDETGEEKGAKYCEVVIDSRVCSASNYP